MSFTDVKKAIAATLYYVFARYLPPTNVPGGGIYTAIRVALVSRFLESVGENLDVNKRVYLGFGRGIRIGSDTGLGNNADLHGPLVIGSHVMISPEVMIHTRNHRISDLDTPIGEQGYTSYETVTIEDDVWVGARSIILPGVTIGRGSVIGAGAVVTKDVPPFSIAAGNPARVVGSRLP